MPPGTYKLVVYDDRNRIIESLSDVRVSEDANPKPVELSTDVEQQRAVATASRPAKRK